MRGGNYLETEHSRLVLSQSLPSFRNAPVAGSICLPRDARMRRKIFRLRERHGSDVSFPRHILRSKEAKPEPAYRSEPARHQKPEAQNRDSSNPVFCR
jgi:hypothetical protein